MNKVEFDRRAGKLAPVPSALVSRNPAAWLSIFGPGAVIASLTIGTGELIFSTRGGVLFGYRVLFLFVTISVLKWGLVFASARHMVLTGVHPYRRMMELPGPRGWLPIVLFLLASICMPIWVSFHSSVVGNLTSWITDTRGSVGGAADFAWGAAALTAVLVLTLSEGYTALERIQLGVVTAMMVCMGVTLVLYNPDWLALLTGAVVPQVYEYPSWLSASYPDIAEQPVWIETTRYVGVIGGAGYDYLAYTSFLREKRWGYAGVRALGNQDVDAVAADARHPARLWVRAPLLDCTLSFIVVVAISAVFVASGVMILGPEQQVPDEANLLNLQARFVTEFHPWLLPLYITAAMLAMVGTLYGTLEVACYIATEISRAVSPEFAERHARRIRRATIVWCSAGAYLVLGWMATYQIGGGGDRPPLLLAILTPANLFTGVLFCGLLCFLLCWMDRRFLPPALRMRPWLIGLNLLAGAIFLALGMKGYWDYSSRWLAIGAILGMFGIGITVAWCRQRLVLTAVDEDSSEF